MDKATASVPSARNGETEKPEETGMEQVLSDLQALKRLYGLLHKGPADENLDDASRALLMRMLDDATQQTLLKQAKMLSGSLMSPVLERKLSIRSDRRARDADPSRSLRPPASPSPSFLGGERPSRLNHQYSTLSSRAGGQVPGHGQAAEEPLHARLASHRSSRTTASALPPRHRPSGELPNSGLGLYRLPVAATSQHGTVAGSNRPADHRDRTRRTSGRGDQSSPEGSSRRRSLSREVSLGPARLVGRGAGRHVGPQSSSSTRRLGRLSSGLSRRGSERVGRGVAATSQHGTVIGSNQRADRRDRTRLPSDRGDQSSLERSSTHSSSWREVSLGRHVRAESSSSTRRFGRLGSGLSPSTTSRRASERAGRGVAAMSRHGTVTGSSRHADRQDRTRHSSSSGDQSSSEGSSRRSSVSREASLGRARLHGRGKDRRVGAGSSSSTRRSGRMASRHGSERAGHGVASLERSSSSKTMVTIRSRITPNRDLKDKERRLRRAENKEEEGSTPRRGRTDASVSSWGWSSTRPPRRPRKRADSGSMYISSRRSSSGAAISYPSTSRMVSPDPSASSSHSPPPVPRRASSPPPVSRRANSPPPVPRQAYSPPQVSQRTYTPAPVSQRGIAWPKYASPYYAPSPVPRGGIAWPVVSRSMRRRRRQEVLQRRVGRLRMLKNKIATVFHHHYHYERSQEGPSCSRDPRDHHLKSPLQYLGGMFHHMKGQVQKTTSRAVVGVQEKRRGGGGGGGRNMHAFLDAMRRHLRDKRRAPASVKTRKMANRSRALGKNMHWWQRLKPRRGKTEKMACSIPRRRWKREC